MRSTYRPPPGMSAGARRPVRAEKDLSPAHADLVPHSSRVALGNHRKRCDLMRIETAGGSHIWPSLPRSRNRPKGLRTAEVGGSNPLTSTCQGSRRAYSNFGGPLVGESREGRRYSSRERNARGALAPGDASGGEKWY